jgi:hypothetical protein
MQTLSAWLLFGLLLAAAYPTATWILRDEPERLLKLLLALGLAPGIFSLLMFAESLIGLPFSVLNIAAPYFALMLPGTLWWLRQPKSWSLAVPPQARLTLLLLTLVSTAVLFNALYFPFYRDDTLGIYKPQAQQMYALRSLIRLIGAESLYLTYAPHLPLVYTFAYVASGWENDYLARLVPALLALGCLPATYLLAQRLGGARAGWLGAIILALTPTFARWASSGYVDLPMAFYYTLAAIFALRLWDEPRARDAILGGVLIGLAAWTKNAGLLIAAPVLTLWLGWCLLRRRIRWRLALLSIIACVAVAGGWYLRNQIGAGFVIPNTAWTDQARQTLDSLLVFVTRPENFALTGWLILIGVALSAAEVIRRRLNTPEHLLILMWTLPFFAAWWLFVSYDPRFLLLFLPPLCALVGAWLSEAYARLPVRWQPRARVVATLGAVIFALYILTISVDYKDSILRDPFMSHEAKLALVQTR